MDEGFGKDWLLSPLENAAKEGNKDEIEQLLNNIQADDNDSCPLFFVPYPLKFAVKYGHSTIAEMIVEKSISFVKDHPSSAPKMRDMLIAGLKAAISTRSLEIVELLIKANVDPNFHSKYYGSLHTLLEEDRGEFFTVECLEWLLAAGADVNLGVECKPPKSNSPFYLACKNAHYPQVIRMLLEHGAITNRQDFLKAREPRKVFDISSNFCPPWSNVVESDLEILISHTEGSNAIECVNAVVDILGPNADIDIKIKDYHSGFKATLLLAAVKHWKSDIVSLLLERGAKHSPFVSEFLDQMNEVENRKPCCLSMAIKDYEEKEGTLRLLSLNDHESINVRFVDLKKQLEKQITDIKAIISLLIENGADPNEGMDFVSRKDLSPLEYVVLQQVKPDIDYMVMLGCDPNVHVSRQHNVFKTLFFSDYDNAVVKMKELLENGLRPNCTFNDVNDTVIEIAFNDSLCATTEMGSSRDCDGPEPLDVLENPMDTGRGCIGSRLMKQLVSYGFRPSYCAVRRAIEVFLACKGKSLRITKLKRIALCTLSKINALYFAGLVERDVYVYAINFYLCRFDLEDFEDTEPQTLQDLSQRAVMRNLNRRDVIAFDLLELPMHLKSKLCFEDSPKSSDFVEMDILSFLRTFSDKKRSTKFEEEEDLSESGPSDTSDIESGDSSHEFYYSSESSYSEGDFASYSDDDYGHDHFDVCSLS